LGTGVGYIGGPLGSIIGGKIGVSMSSVGGKIIKKSNKKAYDI